MGLKPMNCPAHIQIYKSRAALLPRPADPLRRVRARPPPRAERDAARPAARPPHHPGRRPHLLHRGADPGGGAALPRLRLRDLRHVRLRAAARALDPAREARRRPRRCGTGPRRRSRRRSTDKGLEYELNEGDGAFYGPKIDLHMTDSIGREWQLGTVQLDYYMPERFELDYTGADNAEHRPVMIHRALLGSLRALHRHPDRALRGRVPALAGAGAGARAADRRPPRRLRARGRRASCAAAGLRVEVDERTESVGKKIREARAAQGALHAGRRRPRGRGRRGRGAPPRRGRPGLAAGWGVRGDGPGADRRTPLDVSRRRDPDFRATLSG